MANDPVTLVAELERLHQRQADLRAYEIDLAERGENDPASDTWKTAAIVAASAEADFQSALVRNWNIIARLLKEGEQWRARESETQEALQAIGEEFGVRGGEPRVDGIRRVLTEKEKALALSGATLMKLDRTNAELSDALTAAMDCIAGGLAALNASYQQANAEAAGHDKTADRLDKIVQAWRAQARAMVSARPAPARGTL